LKLQPHETRAINIRLLRDVQLADFRKNKIPATATDGSVSWIRIDNVPVMGRLMVIERHKGISSSYDCCTCCCPNSYIGWDNYILGPSDGLPGNILPQAFYASYEDCNAYIYYIDQTVWAIWSSENPNIATVNDYGDVTAVSPGKVFIDATYASYNYQNDNDCTCQGDLQNWGASANIVVQVPTSLSIVSGTDSTTREATCPVGSATGCGITKSFNYQVLDQYGNPITGADISALQFWDSIQTTSPNGLGLSGYTTTCNPPNTGPCGIYVNSQGQFRENGLGVCSTVCYANGTCVTAGYTNADQTWHIGSYSIVQHISYYCDHVLVNGK